MRWSKGTKYCIVNWLNIDVEGFVVVCSWQNGTRCRDDVNILWCHFHLCWLVFEGWFQFFWDGNFRIYQRVGRLSM